MRLFDVALKKDPALAWAHMAMANVYAFGKLADGAKATGHVEAFFKLCPTSYDFYTNRMLGSHGSPEVQKKVAAALRERVQAETLPDLLNVCEHLWNLEFKITPPAEHAGLRKRIADDVRHLRELTPQPTIANLRTIREGLNQAGDQAGVTAVEDEMVRLFPQLQETARIVQERWRKENPYAKPGEPEEKKRQHASALYAVTAKWIEQWPWEPVARVGRLQAARSLKDLAPAEMKAAADQLIRFLRNNEVIYGFQPFAHQAAEEYLRRGIFIEEVPALAEVRLETVRERVARREPSDIEPPDIANRSGGVLLAAEMGAVELLAQAYTRLQKPEKAPELQARLERVTPQEEREKTTKMRVASRVAELSGRKMDAFVYLEKAIELSPKPANDPMKEREVELHVELRSLWASLGGSEETWRLRSERKPAVLEAKADTEWEAPEKIIPAWELTDLAGKRWTADQLAGKTVLVNVWASWCGPCRAEHPHFQKLYEKLKDRTDVAIVSFNVDDQIGLVQPYMEQGKFTFPVLLANRFVMGIFDGISIPRNWLFDSRGTHRLEQIGFGESSYWEQRMTAALETVQRR